MRHFSGDRVKKTAIRHGDWKLVRMDKHLSSGDSHWQLYDLASDVSEEMDRAATHPTKLAELVSLWQKINGEMSEPLF